jgi:hypothetical protein
LRTIAFIEVSETDIYHYGPMETFSGDAGLCSAQFGNDWDKVVQGGYEE